MDDALHEALGLQEYLIALNLPNTAAKLDSEIGAFQTLADAIKSIVIEESWLKVLRGCF